MAPPTGQEGSATNFDAGHLVAKRVRPVPPMATEVTPDGGRLPDFYVWALGDITSNTTRGIYLKWLVARSGR